MLKKSTSLSLVLAILLNLTAVIGAQVQAANRARKVSRKSSVKTTPLSLAPTSQLSRDANARYFNYAGDTIQLLGISGSYLPHVTRNRHRNYNQPSPPINPVKEYCTYDLVQKTDGTTAYKYQLCIDQLKQAGLNHLRLWVASNHSVGKRPVERGDLADGTKPYLYEQPFAWDDAKGKWNLDQWSPVNPTDADGYFKRLYNVVKYCQDKGIIVGVTLFDPWSGWDEALDQPTRSPWYEGNNYSAKYPNGVGFTDPYLFVKAEDPTKNPETEEIDIDPRNKEMRLQQVRLIQRTINALYPLNNYYYELANEPERSNVLGAAVVNWHKYMAKKLWDWEQHKGGRHHLIAANLSTKDAIDGLIPDSRIDIINGHYVHFEGNMGSVLEDNRMAAIKLLRAYNLYRNDGLQGLSNTKIWGFNEGRISGIPTTSPDLYHEGDPVTGAGVRIEAWEFMLNGGGLFDHLSYRWANPLAADNFPVSDESRKFLGYLSRFLNTIPLAGMKRTTGNQTAKWIANLPVYGSPYWAAMSNGNVHLLYLHQSTISNHGFAKYNPKPGSSFTNTITVQNLGTTTGNYTAEWYRPDGSGNSVTNGVLQPLGAFTTTFPWSPGQTRNLTTPAYGPDIVLKITRNPT